MIKTQFNGHEISLYMSGGAMFELDAIRLAWNDGHVEPVLGVQELLMDLDGERLQILAQVVEILERAALAAKRALGQDEFPVIPAVQIQALAKPRDLPILTNAAGPSSTGLRPTPGTISPSMCLCSKTSKKKQTQIKSRFPEMRGDGGIFGAGCAGDPYAGDRV